MTRSRNLDGVVGLLALAVAVCGPIRPVAAQEADATLSCDVAAAAAERRFDLPTGMLRAIGRVESGRRNPANGQITAWPWTINAEGRGHSFQSRAEALTATRVLQTAGVASIDVGCFQVNLVHHPAAFATLDDGFDPTGNAEYAARFLVSLRARSGTWDGAIAAYHSSTPGLGAPYRDRVVAGWPNGPVDTTLSASVGAVGSPSVGATAGPAVPQVVRVVTWSAAKVSGPMRIWTPSSPGQGASIIRITRG